MKAFFKKTLTLIVALSMAVNIFSSFTTAYAEEPSATNDAQDAYNFLVGTGIFPADAEAFEPELKITRAHFVKLALHISGDAPDVLNSDGDVFTDVNSSTEYESYIETAYKIGYISYNASGLFNPGSIITLSEATKILCEILGYGSLANELGGYPAGYYTVAGRIKLLSGISLSHTEQLDMANAILLCRNALEADLMQFESFGEGINMKVKKGETLLSEIHSIDYIEGIITETFHTNLWSAFSELEKNQVMINNEVFEDLTGIASGYIGNEVKAYHRIDDGDSKLQILYFELTDQNKIVTADLKDVIFENTHAIYYDEACDAQLINFDDEVSIIENNKAKICAPSELSAISGGTVSFISNDGDKKADIIFVKSYSTHVITGVDKTSCLIVTNDGLKFEVDETDEEYTVHIIRDGADAKFSNLCIGDSVLICQSGNMQNGHVEILASSKVVTGVLSELGEDYVVIFGEKYALSDFIRGKVTVGKSYTAKINAFGEICSVQIEDDVVYGYLYDISDAKGFNNPMCKIFTENNRWGELYFADKIIYNGEKITADSLYRRLSNLGDDMCQMIRYRVNDNAEIVRLETASDIAIGSEKEQDAIESNTFRKSIATSGRYRQSSRSFEGRLYLGANTKIFVVPDDMDEDKFKICPYNALIDNGKSYSYTAYDVDEMLRCNVLEMAVIDDTASQSTDTFMIVDSVGTKLNREGDVLPSISGYRKGSKISFPVCVGEDGVSQQTLNSLKKGDMVHVKFNKRSEINHLNVYQIDIEYYSPYGTYGSGAIIVGHVTGLDPSDSKIRVKYDANGSEMCLIYNTSMSVYVWDKSDEAVYKTSALDILPGDKIYTNLTNLVANEIVLVRE